MTKRTSSLAELAASYFAEDDARLERYQRNTHVAARRHSLHELEIRYLERRNKKGTPLLGRIFYHLHEHLYPENRVYTVRNGKVVSIHDNDMTS